MDFPLRKLFLRLPEGKSEFEGVFFHEIMMGFHHGILVVVDLPYKKKCDVPVRKL